MCGSALLFELWECVIFPLQQPGILLPWSEIGQKQTSKLREIMHDK